MGADLPSLPKSGQFNPFAGSLRASRNAVRRGDVVAGKYRLVRELGSGSQGRVWEGVHLQMGTPLAVKVLDPNLASRPDYVSRFKREASAAAALRSPHVVQIFDFGIWEEIPYIAMELLEGEDLGSRLDRNGRLPAPAVSAIVTQVSRALIRAHKRSIVHRDMKPDNIYLCTDDEGEAEIVKILDFGVAKAVGGVSLARTGTGVVLGTPYYMSPEQAQGEKRIDHRTDLWALGVITFEAIVGRRPFEATNLGDLLVKICATDPPRPSDLFAGVPEGFDEWFLRACARNPDDRFTSAKEMAATLAILCGTIPATLSDSSYVALFPQRESAVDLSGEPKTGRDGPMSSTIGENEPTQVMTELPEGLRIEVEKRLRPAHPARNAAPAAGRMGESPIEEEPPAPVDRDDEPPAPAVRSPLPAPPILRQRPTSSSPPREMEDDEDDPVEMFNAADVAANMAQLKRDQELAEVRKRRREMLLKAKWPIVGAALVLVAIVTAVIAMWTR
ncbi:MAG: serine/threonine-protein kinase [Myxococcota bacterium]